MIDRDVELSLQAYEVLLRRFNLGEPHPTLRRQPLWYTPDERRQLDIDTDNELAERQLLRSGRLDPSFLDTLRLLQAPPIEYYAYTKLDGESASIRALRTPQEAAVIVSKSDTMRIYPSRTEAAIRDLTLHLPKAKPAHIQSLSCAIEDYQAVASGATTAQITSSITDAKQIVRWVKGPKQGFGLLYAAIRDRFNRRIATERAPKWIDTESGRMLIDVDERNWLNLTGAGAQDIIRKLHELESRLR